MTDEKWACCLVRKMSFYVNSPEDQLESIIWPFTIMELVRGSSSQKTQKHLWEYSKCYWKYYGTQGYFLPSYALFIVTQVHLPMHQRIRNQKQQKSLDLKLKKYESIWKDASIHTLTKLGKRKENSGELVVSKRGLCHPTPAPYVLHAYGY